MVAVVFACTVGVLLVGNLFCIITFFDFGTVGNEGLCSFTE